MGRAVSLLREIFTDPLNPSVLEHHPAGEAYVRKGGGPAGGGGPVYVAQHFKLIFLSVLAISVIAGGAQLWVVAEAGGELAPASQDLVAWLRTVSTGGTGAIFGLIGGKAA